MQNPFTTTFSKFPEYTYISTIEPKEIIDNFSYDHPSEAVYKITGLRGSGKTVVLASVQEEFKLEENRINGWSVYTLNPARNMLTQLAAYLYSESFIKENSKSKSINLSASAFGFGGGIGYSKTIDDRYFDYGVEIRKMLDIVKEENRKIMICIDDVSKTPDMVVFALECSGWILSGYPIYIVCTGLYENILELGNTKNLTFFRRGKTIETKPLHIIKMSEMYIEKLGVDNDTAIKLAELTRGYAYAFQQLGALYFQNDGADIKNIISELKSELFSYSYEKIWEELSPKDKAFVMVMNEERPYKREEMLKLLGKDADKYSVYRDRLLKRGIIIAKQGYIELNPPFFSEYVSKYGKFM